MTYLCKIQTRITVDPVPSQADIAELAKLGAQIATSTEIRNDSTNGASVELNIDPREAIAVIADLVAVVAVAYDKSPNDVLSDAQRRLTDVRHVPVDQKPSDTRGIGEGHVDGH